MKTKPIVTVNGVERDDVATIKRIEDPELGGWEVEVKFGARLQVGDLVSVRVGEDSCSPTTQEAHDV